MYYVYILYVFQQKKESSNDLNNRMMKESNISNEIWKLESILFE